MKAHPSGIINAPSPFIEIDFPNDVLQTIIENLSISEVKKASLVCIAWRNSIYNGAQAKTLKIRKLYIPPKWLTI
jgi:hypothetical protein